MRRRYLDAMSLVQRFGKPDIFLTMTCNPSWEEIIKELAPGQSAQDRPDLVARVFKGKLEDLKKLIFKKKFFGEVDAYVYVIEFQKIGLPHAHFFIILKSQEIKLLMKFVNIEMSGLYHLQKQYGGFILLISGRCLLLFYSYRFTYQICIWCTIKILIIWGM